ncbi:hypothetical protein J7M23_09595 [Candidatus Sumerlaeota bacterium]|nr:hypothetical protein [Candidatus Sumerlaeota bacterium]
MSTLYTVVHDYPPEKRTVYEPLVNGEGISVSLGYVCRRKLLIFWATESEINTLIENEGKTGGYEIEKPPVYSFAVHPSIKLYNVEVDLIKYSPTPL